MVKHKIFLLDDHKIVRDGLKSVLALNPNYLVIGEESNPDLFLAHINELDIDLLILDISFPKHSGIDLISIIRKQRPQLLIVMLSMYNNPEYMFKCMKEGANCYLPKDIDTQELINALDNVTKNKMYFPSGMKFHQNEDVQLPHQMSNPLSDREKEVLSFIASGLSSKQIAGGLKLSPRTVETHRLNIMKKLGTSNTAETISLAVRMNLLNK